MNSEHTKDPADSRSFEERVFARFDALDERLDRSDARLDRVDARLERVDACLERVEAKLEKLNERVMSLEIQWRSARLKPNPSGNAPSRKFLKLKRDSPMWVASWTFSAGMS